MREEALPSTRQVRTEMLSSRERLRARAIARSSIAAVVGMIGVSDTLAQETSVNTLGSIVVTGTRTERNADDSPVRTQVVTQEEIERTGARTVGEAIRNLAGISLSEIHGKSGHQVSIQGLTSDQVLVLVDGLAVTPSTGSTVDLSQLLIGDVARIEIVKGAASTQYGSAAMGGVINVITRPIEPGISGNVEVGVGSRGSQNVSGESVDSARRHFVGVVEGGSQQWRWRLAADGLNDDGFALDSAAWARQGDHIRRKRVLGRLSWHGRGGSELFTQWSHYDESDMQRFNLFFPPNLVPQRKTEEIERRRLTAGGLWALGGGRQLSVKLLNEHYDSGSETFSQAVRTVEREAEVVTRQFSAQFDMAPFESQLWQFGADLKSESLSQVNNGVDELENGQATWRSEELFAQNEIFLTDTLSAGLGVRWQQDADFGQYFAPKLSLRHETWLSKGWQVVSRFNAGRGYRVPNLKERFFLFDHSAFGYVVRGNPALRPERSNSFQLGASFIRGRHGRLEINGFYNRITDLIQIDSSPSGTFNGVQAFEYDNVAHARTTGVELGAQWQMSKSFSLAANVTLTRSRDLVTGAELTRRPDQMGRIKVDWNPSRTTSLAARVRLQSSELVRSESGVRSPGWGVTDVSATRWLSNKSRLIFSVQNLFDRQRDFDNSSDFGPRSGRLVSVAYRFDFGANRSQEQQTNH